MKEVDVSIVFVNYHTSNLIADCISTIREHSRGFSYEIIIVDNRTEPSLKEDYAQEVDCSVICLEENVGFGRANNVGFDHARGRYLLCLNPDTLLLNNAIGHLVDFMDSHPDAGACGGNLYGPDMQPTLSFRRIVPGFKWEINEFLNLLPEKKQYGPNRVFNTSGKPMQVGYITGADLMLRREVIHEIGGFDKRFFMYYEETDLCVRIHTGKWKVYNVPMAQIQHLEGESMGSKGRFNKRKVEMTEFGRLTYYAIHFNALARLCLDIIYFITLFSRSILLPDGPRRQIWRHRFKCLFKRIRHGCL